MTLIPFSFPFFLAFILVSFLFFLMGDEQLVQSFPYLHSNENPTITLVSLVLDVCNYRSRSISIIIALSAKNKLEFILGIAPRPTKDNSTFSSWYRCNDMVVSIG